MTEKALQLEAPDDSKQIQESQKFPKSVLLIVVNEFCERFSYSGMRAFLALYLKQKLMYSDNEATEVYHIFTTMAYFFPVFGAILADCYFGKFRTILYLMIVYAAGNIILAVTAVPPFHIPAREFTILGLFLVALGTGGIKPNVSAFGGDQFTLPQQEKQLTYFFSMFYFIICMGSLIAKSVSPILRSEIHCFGDKDCYSIAFGAPGILIIISILMFYFAKNMFVIKKPTGNVILDLIRCIYRAVFHKKSASNEKRPKHWLDNAQDYFEQAFIEDVKKTLAIFILFTPLPVFWALLDQMGSRWTLQATKMDGDFGFYTFKPDQMQVLGPIIIIIIIPFFRQVVYPFLDQYGILRNYLHRLIAGCVLAGLAFICSGLLELKIEKTMPILPSPGLGQLRIFNGFGCHLKLSNNMTGQTIDILPYGVYENKFISVEGKLKLTYNAVLVCDDYQQNSSDILTIEENKATSVFYKMKLEGNGLEVISYEDHNAKSRSGFPLVRILANTANTSDTPVCLWNSKMKKQEFCSNSTLTNLTEVFSAKHELIVHTQHIPGEMDLKIGGVYTVIVDGNAPNKYTSRLLTISEPNSVSMTWVFPQIVIISTGEVLFAITGLEYAFIEAPKSMKSVLQAYWYLIEAFGNVLIIVVTRLGAEYRQASQFFFFAALMFVATFIFYILARRHQKNKMVAPHPDVRYSEVLQSEENMFSH